MKKFLTLIIMSIINVHVFAQCDSSKLVNIVKLIKKRESMMKSVAAYKWYYAPNHQASAYSAEQEINVLKHVDKIARKTHVNPISLMLFSQVQMDISKQIESYWINQWNKSTTQSLRKPNLATTKNIKILRKEISGIDKQLFSLIPKKIPEIKGCSAEQLHPIFKQSFKSIKGIPIKPSFIGMLIVAFKKIH